MITTAKAPFQDVHPMGSVIVSCSGPGPETGLINVTNLFRVGQINSGIQIQAHGVSITPSITMAPAEDAMNPARDGQVPWKSFDAITAGDIIQIPYGATVLKLLFAGAGQAHVGTI